MKKATKILLALGVTLIIGAVGFYVTLPALNVANQEFWGFLTFLAVTFCVAYWIIGLRSLVNIKDVPFKNHFKSMPIKIGAAIAVIPLLVLLVGNISSSTFFNAKKYSDIIEVKEGVFETEMPENDLVSNIALMDTASATILGNRTLGALSDVVSQYQMGGAYTQINYQKTPQKVSHLEYADFFRWLNNRDKGVPGYVMVDPVNNDAEYIMFSKPMKYVDSGFFSDDLHRALRFSYPTKIFGSYSFEVDDLGNPYYIVSCMSPRIGLFGALDVEEVIIFDPCTGTNEIYALEDVPSWVDNVFTGSFASQKYDWHGTLKNGYWNSIIGKKDCKVTTDDFGYIVLDDDVWFFTGVTSVTSDESNIGFIISNARTGEYKFYPVIGAEEYSAMESAEGIVQEKGYKASFPSLINVSGEATYIMVLKDSGGLVRLYALVNVKNYNIVATAQTQTEAKKAYVELLKSQNIISGDVSAPDIYETAEVSVKDVKTVTVNGNSIVYITAEDGYLYKQSIAVDESVILISLGDKLEVSYDVTGVEKIRQIVDWTFAE